MRDYANQPKKPSRRGWLIVLLLIILASVICATVFIRKQPTKTTASEPTKPKPAPTIQKTTHAPKAKTKTQPAVTYDFYRMLPKMKVAVQNNPETKKFS